MPNTEGYYFFRGVRIVRDTHRVAVDAPVQVLQIWNRGKLELGVSLLGMQRRYPLSAFVGEWTQLSVVMGDSVNAQNQL